MENQETVQAFIDRLGIKFSCKRDYAKLEKLFDYNSALIDELINTERM